MLILALIATVIFIVGSVLDAKYSSGQKEKNKLFQNSKGYFSATKYWLISGGGGAMCWTLSLLYPHWSMFVATAGVLGYLGVYRLSVALRTKRLLQA